MDELVESGSVFLGWDVGGTRSAAVVGTAAGSILSRDEYPSLAERGPEAMIGDFVGRSTEGAGALLRKHPSIRRMGVSVGGPMNALTGTVLGPPHLPGWDNVPLAQILRDKLGLDVTVEHDAAACLLAERLWGEARGATHAVYLTMGSGCGAGIMVGGRILRGPGG